MSPQTPPFQRAAVRLRQGALMLLILAALDCAVGCGSKSDAQSATTKPSDAQASKAVAVVAVAARRADMPIYFTGLGSVVGLNTATVRSRVDGTLDKVAFTEGQTVKAGDVLAQIDPRQFQVQLTSAEGQLAKDQALLENAKVDLVRFKKAQDAASQQQLDTQQSLVKQDEGVVKIDQSQIDAIKLNLDYCRITAPFTGRIGLRLVDQGNLIHASDANGLAVITQLQPITVSFTLPQDDIPRLMARMKNPEPIVVEAYNRDMTAQIADGVVAAVDNQVDPSSGTIRIKATFKNDDYSLFPNQFVNARLLVDVRKDAVIVPSAAIQQGPDAMTFVYVVKEDHTVEVRKITPGPVEADQTCIDNGLEVGELVVTEGVDKLKNGSAVTARTDSAKSKSDQSDGNADSQSSKAKSQHKSRQPKAAATQPAEPAEGQ